MNKITTKSNLLIISKSKSKNVILIASTVCVFSIIAGARYFGYEKDYFWYKYIYDACSDVATEMFLRYEPGFLLLNIFSNNLKLSFVFFSTLSIAVSLGIKFYILSDGRYLVIPIIIYVTWLSWLHEATQIRAALAIAFFNLALFYLCRNKTKYGIISYCIAISMHLTSLLFFPVFLIGLNSKDKRIKTHVVVAVSLAAFFAAIYLSKFVAFHPNGTSYLESTNVFSILSFRTIPLFALLILIYLDKLKNFEMQVYLFACFYSVVLAAGFYNLGEMANRILEFCFFSYLLLVNNKAVGSKKSSILLSILLLYTCIISYKYLFVDGGYFNQYIIE